MGENIDIDDERRLEDILEELGPEEKLILTMNRADADESDDLIQLLEEKGFIVEPKGGHGDDYYLHCWKPSDTKK